MLVLAAFATACSGGTGAAPTAAPVAEVPDSGVSLAQASGATLLVLSLDPAEPGQNDASIKVLNTVGAFVIGSVRIDATLDGVPIDPLSLAPTARSGKLTFAHAGRAEVGLTVLDGQSAGATAAFDFDLPAQRVSASTLANIDGAMKGLHTLRERQTLSAGGPQLLYTFEYQAPDRVRYTTIAPSGMQETRLIGRDRYDRPVGGTWTKSDLGFPSRVPFSDYARGSTRVRLLGRHTIDGVELLDLAFVQGDFYYRLQVGADDDLVRSYTMMGRGHFMSGTYSDYDAVLSIATP